MAGPPHRSPLLEKALLGAASRFGPLLVRALGATWRIAVANAEAEERARAGGGPLVYACWHGQMLPLGYVRRGRGVSVLVSLHRDGEAAARVFGALGYDVVRGSTSRGSARGAAVLLARMRRGCDVAVMPDGPRGPAGLVQEGAMRLAVMAGVPVVPVAAAARPALRLSSWDRFLVPWAFARVAVAFADPIATGPDLDVAEASRLLTMRLREATANAEALVCRRRSEAALPRGGAASSFPYGAYRALTWAAWALALPWLAAVRARGRGEWRERLGVAPDVVSGGVWVHAASVGEVGAAAPLIRELLSRGVVSLVTVETRAGRDVAARTWKGLPPVAFAPLDLVPAVRAALARVRPRALLLVETELWPNLIVEAVRAGISVGVVNGRLSPRSARRYQAPGSPFPAVAGLLSFVACQSSEDRDRFIRIGVSPSRVTEVGNLKYDALARPLRADERGAIARSLGVPDGAPVAVFGSVRPMEEADVVRAAREIARARPDACVVVAPRHVARTDAIASAFGNAGLPAVRRSLLGDAPRAAGRPVVLDSTGELAAVYSIAAVAFVGGSLAPYGGHNPLEPAAHGVPVIIGPHTESCRDSAARLLAAGGAIGVDGADAMRDAVLSLLNDAEQRHTVGQAALAAVDAGRGATGRTVAVMRSVGILERDEEPRSHDAS